MYSEHVPLFSLGAHYPRLNGIFCVPTSGTRFRPHRAANFSRFGDTPYCVLFR